jgi:hypothetical protein
MKIIKILMFLLLPLSYCLPFVQQTVTVNGKASDVNLLGFQLVAWFPAVFIIVGLLFLALVFLEIFRRSDLVKGIVAAGLLIAWIWLFVEIVTGGAYQTINLSNFQYLLFGFYINMIIMGILLVTVYSSMRRRKKL